MAFMRFPLPAGGQNLPEGFRYTPAAKVDRSGIVRAFYDIGPQPPQGSPERSAAAFLRQNRVALGIQDVAAHLRTESIVRVAGGSHVRFTQMCGGLPVYRGDVIVSTNEAGVVSMDQNRLRPADESEREKSAGRVNALFFVFVALA
jgi:Zn-dependent metalloprotease